MSGPRWKLARWVLGPRPAACTAESRLAASTPRAVRVWKKACRIAPGPDATSKPREGEVATGSPTAIDSGTSSPLR